MERWSTLVVKGWTEADRILEVGPAGVSRGMSGSPVLNVRTGAVCGVLTRGDVQPRARAQVSGGRVISARRLFALSPTLSSDNSRHHTTHRGDWFDLLPADQKRLIIAQHPSDPAALPDQLLVISVDQTDDEWEVSATIERNDEDHGSWGSEASFGPIKVDLNSVRALVARVFRDWASRDAAEQGRVGPGEQIRLLGEILSGALLTGEIGRTFDELIAHQDVGWLEVALHFSEDVADPDFREFVQLPWEHLYVPQRGTRGDVYFAREQKLAFVRTLCREPSTPDPPDGRMSLLVVAVRPEAADAEVDDVASRDVAEITAALEALGTALPGSLDVTVVDSPGLHGLTEAVKSCDYDAVHYVGVGRFDTGTDDRVALSIDPSVRSGYHNASDFGACLDEGMPRLVVLQVPRGPETVPPDLAGFGPALLRKGCLAVVAHQYPVKSGLTQTFNTAFYTALAVGDAAGDGGADGAEEGLVQRSGGAGVPVSRRLRPQSRRPSAHGSGAGGRRARASEPDRAMANAGAAPLSAIDELFAAWRSLYDRITQEVVRSWATFDEELQDADSDETYATALGELAGVSISGRAVPRRGCRPHPPRRGAEGRLARGPALPAGRPGAVGCRPRRARTRRPGKRRG